ncbi:MAG: trehalose-phosphatase [Candidatus Euphemobacter frigidus]|nr:trehalose-phosphatase [Candidatus Euphemobacter frigidus]
MRPLLRNWSPVAARITGAEVILFGFDYDGTLSPIVRRPEWARLSEETFALLKALTSHPRYFPAIISGRSLTEIRDLVGLPGLIYAGNHGLELEGPSLRFLHPDGRSARPILTELLKCLEEELRGIDGVQVEDKGLTISVHFRRVDENNLDRTLRIIETITKDPVRRGQVKVTSGKKVIEIRPPVDWNKGKIITWLQREVSRVAGGKKVLTVYTGDDRTDEDAFRVIGEKGITIRVGRAEDGSNAQYYLNGVEEVRSFISRLVELY